MLRPLVLGSLVFLLTPTLAAQSFTDLGSLAGYAEILPSRVSADGEVVVGLARTFPQTELEVFRWANGSVQGLGRPSGRERCWHAAVSGDGSRITMSCYEPNGWSPRGYLWQNGALALLPEPPPHPGDDPELEYYEAFGLSRDGSTAVGYSSARGAVSWINGAPVSVSAQFSGLHPAVHSRLVSADGSVVVYSSGRPGDVNAGQGGTSRTTRRIASGALSTLVPPAGTNTMEVLGLSGDGNVLVGFAAWVPEPLGGDLYGDAYVWTPEAGAVLLPAPEFALHTRAHAVSDDGRVIVGTYYDGQIGRPRAAVWIDGQFFVLRDLLQSQGLDLGNWILYHAMDVTPDGRVIVGRGWDTSLASSRGWRAELAPRLVVNSAEDRPAAFLDRCDTGETVLVSGAEVPECTLRAAIEFTNTRAERDSVAFAIPGDGPHVIALAAGLPPVTAPLVLDATTQPDYDGSPLVVLDGTAGALRGLDLAGGDSVVRGLAIGGFAEAGIRISGPGGDAVEASYLGLGPDGVTPLPNGTGIRVEGAPSVTIGGDSGDQRNLISGNAERGVYATGAASGTADSLRIAGNWIGLDAAGAQAVPNGAVAVELRGAMRAVEVSANAFVTGGNQGALALVDLGGGDGAPDGARITGNTIGTNPAGAAVLGDTGLAIVLTSAGDATGGVARIAVGEAEQGNRIVALLGVFAEGQRSTGLRVVGNEIGLLANGQLARDELGLTGVYTALADSATVADNVIGGQAFGVLLASDANEVYGNRLGTNPTGTSARANAVGLFIPSELVAGGVGRRVGSDNVVGREGEGNVVSGNTNHGILLGGLFTDPFGRPAARDASATLPAGDVSSIRQAFRSAASAPAVPAPAARASAGDVSAEASRSVERPTGNIIAYNLLGTNAAGTAALGNGLADDPDEAGAGLLIHGGSGTVVFGNTISGNGVGLAITNEEFSTTVGPEATLAAGNRIGAAATANEPVPNQYLGVVIYASDGNALLAAPLAEGGEARPNLIFGNDGPGVRVIYAEGLGRANTVRQSSFLENEGVAFQLWHFGSPGNLPPGTPAAPEVLSARLTGGGAEVVVRPAASGPLDFFVTTECRALPPPTDDEGAPVPSGDGLYVFSADGSAGQRTAFTIPAGALPDSPLGLYVSATTTTAGDDAATSPFSGCARLGLAANAAEVEIPDGYLGPVDGLDPVGLGLEVEGHDAWLANRGESGRLFVTRHTLPPHGSTFEGEASSDDGTLVEPSAVAAGRYWTLTPDGLGGLTYAACLDVGGLEEDWDPARVVVVHRAHAGFPWMPLPSRLAAGGGRLCASGLTAFGELGIGGVMVTNTETEAEGAAPLALSAYPNPSRDAVTLTLSLPASGDARVEVYDLLGRRVALLHDGPAAAGTHALSLPTRELAAGVYIARAVTPAGSASHRLTVAR